MCKSAVEQVFRLFVFDIAGTQSMDTKHNRQLPRWVCVPYAHGRTRTDACTNKRLYKFLRTCTLIALMDDTERQNAYKIKHIDKHIRAVMASAFGRYFSGGYPNFCFRSEPYYKIGKGGRFHHVACFMRSYYKGKNPLWRRKRLCQNAYIRFSPGIKGCIVKHSGRNSTIYQFFRWEILLWKMKVIFFD